MQKLSIPPLSRIFMLHTIVCSYFSILNTEKDLIKETKMTRRIRINRDSNLLCNLKKLCSNKILSSKSYNERKMSSTAAFAENILLCN